MTNQSSNKQTNKGVIQNGKDNDYQRTYGKGCCKEKG